MNLQLRNYQSDAIESINKAIDEGTNKPIIVLATGLGKTVIFVHLIVQLVRATNKKALIIAHREELLTQARDKILTVDPDLKVSIEMAQEYADPDADVVIASVATLGRTGSSRIQRFDPNDFCLIVTDEAHHASASSYKNIYRHFGVLKDEMVKDNHLTWQPTNEVSTDWNKACTLLGVTATPSRNDNEGIDKIFDDVVYTYGILDGIRDGWLSRIRAFRVDTKTSLENVHTRAGDFAQDELADAINNPERNSLVVKTYLEQFDGKQALVFAIDVAHMNALYLAFRDKGIQAAPIDGTTPKDLRKEYLELFHTKQIQVVVNCMVLTEGYDNDTIDVVMMARPTKSGILYSQMIGRGTRIHQDKPHLTICDFVDNTYKHTIKTSASLLGIQGMVNFRGGDILESWEKIQEIQDMAPEYNLDKLDFDRLDYIMEEVDLMSGLDIPVDLKGLTENSWHKYGTGGYRVGIGDGRYLVIEQAITGQWKARYQEWNKDTKAEIVKELGEEDTLEQIVKRVDKYIGNNHEDSLYLINMNAKWRLDKPTEKQVFALQRLGVAQSVIDQLNKGQASQLQTKLYAVRRKPW